MALLAKSPAQTFAGVGIAAVFGVCLLLFLKMLKSLNIKKPD